MKKLLLSIFLPVMLFAQTPVEKLLPALETKLSGIKPGEKVLVWVFFNDKGNSLNKFYSAPAEVVSEKSLKRREKVLPKEHLLQFEDIPVSSSYIAQLQAKGFTVKQKSKWLNGVSGYISKKDIPSVEALPCVKNLDIVYEIKKPTPVVKSTNRSLNKVMQPEGTYVFNYGSSYTQNQQINVPAVHNLGYTGQGVTICVMDAGFSNLPHECFQNMNIIAKWDFVNNDPDVSDGSDMGEGSHGTMTLSTIGGYKDNKQIGPAFGATFILAKTENTDSETPVEEDNWIAALEWADSIGVDVTSTSLGYIDFDAPYTSYTWQSMDGNTCRITKAADLAVGLGIVVVNSAGNEGDNSSHNTLGAPADGDSVITAGAVDDGGGRSYFSSVGPTVDGRTKPDIMAMGEWVNVASPYSTTEYTTADGTSFSCPLSAGVAALIVCARPFLTPMQVRDAMRNTASRHTNPDNKYGWGILNALDAVNYFPLPVELTSFTGNYAGGKVVLNWITATEKNNRGFEVERKSGSAFEKIAFVAGNGTSTEQHNYSFTDNVPQAGKNVYRLKQVDYDGTSSYSSEVEVENVISSYKLYQNYPNPFNPSTVIKYSLPVEGKVKIAVYDILGKEVKILLNDTQTSGEHEIQLNGAGMSSGVYFVDLTANTFHQAIKVILSK